MLHNICMSAVAMSLRWANRGPWASCFKFMVCFSETVLLFQLNRLFKLDYNSNSFDQYNKIILTYLEFIQNL